MEILGLDKAKRVPLDKVRKGVPFVLAQSDHITVYVKTQGIPPDPFGLTRVVAIDSIEQYFIGSVIGLLDRVEVIELEQTGYQEFTALN